MPSKPSGMPDRITNELLDLYGAARATQNTLHFNQTLVSDRFNAYTTVAVVGLATAYAARVIDETPLSRCAGTFGAVLSAAAALFTATALCTDQGQAEAEMANKAFRDYEARIADQFEHTPRCP